MASFFSVVFRADMRSEIFLDTILGRAGVIPGSGIVTVHQKKQTRALIRSCVLKKDIIYISYCLRVVRKLPHKAASKF